MLAFTLRHKPFTIMVTLLIFAGSYYLFDKHVTKGRIWSWGEDTYLVVTVNMPTGAEIERTDAITRHFEEHLVVDKNIDKIFTNVSPENARLHITFPREVQLTAVPLILKEQLTNLAVQIAGPDVGVFGFGPGFYSGGGSAPQFRLQVLGYNYNQVKRIADDVGRKLARNPRVRNVDTNSSLWGSREDLFETVLRVDQQKLQRFQLTSAEVWLRLVGC